mmetsp:Transcript_5433/g.8842  ORF Transcript_5433/g.8842 Transcript_5433/m.8842 type:complete len:118 (-) Transcript_5433:273-626(-)
MREDGSLIGTAKAPSAKSFNSGVQAAIISNLWSDYQRAGSRVQSGPLDVLVMNCEAGRIGAMRLHDGYIAAACGKNVTSQTLRDELTRLRDALGPVLASLEAEDSQAPQASNGAAWQ